VQRPPWVIRRASCGVAVQPRCDAGPDRNRAPGPGRARAALQLRASASNGPREGPSVYCAGALRKALARGSKGVHVRVQQRRCPGVCEGTAGRGAHPRLAQVVHQLTQGGPGCATGVLAMAAPALAGGVLYEAQENTPGIEPEYYPR